MFDPTSFWERASRPAGGCWEWQFSLDTHGYGHMWIEGRLRLAHRVAWELEHGSIPEGMFVCHRCDNRKCVRPDHLFLGTHTDNMRDMSRKGRSHAPRPQPPGTHAGEANGRAKLTANDARMIRTLYAAGDTTHVRLAAEYGVAFSTIARIVDGRGWRNA